MGDILVIFDQLKGFLKEYQPPLTPKKDTSSYFDLWSLKNLVIEGRKRKEIFFAGTIIQKGYVGFYFMPVYVEAEVKNFFEPELLACLKGKSCFHIKQNDPILMDQITQALKIGFELYQERGWV